MTSLSERLPMIPIVQTFSRKADEAVRPYLGWQLLEVEADTSEILICKPGAAGDEHNRSKHLIILAGRLARAWLRLQDVAQV